MGGKNLTINDRTRIQIGLVIALGGAVLYVGSALSQITINTREIHETKAEQKEMLQAINKMSQQLTRIETILESMKKTREQ